MNLGPVSDLTQVVALIGGVGGLIAGLIRASTWLNNWVAEDRIKASLDRKKVGLEVAQQLDDMGEHFWAAEVHERAWMDVLRRLARFEVNRARTVRFVVAYIGWLLYFGAMGLALASKIQPWLSVAGVGSLFAAMGIGMWFFATKPGFERSVTARAKEKYERHKRDGRITRPSCASYGDADAAGWAAVRPKPRLFGGGREHLMALVVGLKDVESGAVTVIRRRTAGDWTRPCGVRAFEGRPTCWRPPRWRAPRGS